MIRPPLLFRADAVWRKFRGNIRHVVGVADEPLSDVQKEGAGYTIIGGTQNDRNEEGENKEIPEPSTGYRSESLW